MKLPVHWCYGGDDDWYKLSPPPHLAAGFWYVCRPQLQLHPETHSSGRILGQFVPSPHCKTELCITQYIYDNHATPVPLYVLTSLLSKNHSCKFHDFMMTGTLLNKSDVKCLNTLSCLQQYIHLVIPLWMGEELSCRQTKNWVNFDFQMNFDLEGQGQSPNKQ